MQQRLLRDDASMAGNALRELLFVEVPVNRYPPDTTTPLHILIPRLAREAAAAMTFNKENR